MTGDRIQQLRAIVESFDLNQHPFYNEWRHGTLPAGKLANYACGFEPFVAAVPSGWEAAGRPDYAAEEREHHALWRRFAAALDAPASDAWDSPHTRMLTAVAESLFRSAPEAIGALYAFEAQQPVTTRSKLDGLRDHYHLNSEAEEYFRVHTDDWQEAWHLEDIVRELPEPDYQRARSACGLMAAALWSGLDGVYYETGAQRGK